MGRRKENQCLLFAGLSLAMLDCWGYIAYTTTSTLLTYVAGAVSVVMMISIIILLDIWRLSPADSQSWLLILKQYAILTVFKIKGKKSFSKLMDITKQIPTQQEELLREILESNKDTDHGAKYKFSLIADHCSREEYRNVHPLTTYKDYEQDIARLMKGENNILTRDEVVFLAMSSGTTGKEKYIPVTSIVRKELAGVISTMSYLMNKKVGLSLGKTVCLGYKPQVTQTPSGLVCGPVSSRMTRHVPWYTSPPSAFEIEDEQTALYVHAVFALAEPEVAQFDAYAATLLYSFWCLVKTSWQDICKDIERGDLKELSNLKEETRKQLLGYLIPNPDRAEFLRHEFSRGFPGIGTRIWPKWKIARMITTGALAHYAKTLREIYMPGVNQVSMNHAASEGFLGMNVSFDAEDDTYMVMPLYGVMEFIPEKQIQEEQPKTLLLEQLEQDCCYEMVITTKMGLYRYRTGDVIKITGFQNQCPLYEFQYRSGQLLNLHMEHTPETAFYESLLDAVGGLGASLVDYTATESIHLSDLSASQSGDMKHYVVFVELSKDDGHTKLNEEQKLVFDKCLGEYAPRYLNLRKANGASAMRVVQVKEGTFSDLRHHLLANTRNLQVKIPRATRRKDILEFLIARQMCDSV